MADTKTRHVIADHRGGRNGQDAAWAIADTECADAVNVDFYRSMLGNKRSGLLAAAVTSASFTGVISSLFRHVPSTDVTAQELWGADDAATPVINRLAGGSAWAAPTLKDNPTGNGWDMTGASINGKFFLAYKSAQGRLHCWDTATVRRAGLAVPAAPTAANYTGSASSIALDATGTLSFGATKTFTHTCGANATLLFVYVRVDGSTCTVTYNTVAMTQLGTVSNGGGDYYLFALASPATGAHTVAITTAAANTGAASVSYNQTAILGIPDAITTNTSAGTGILTSLTTISDNAWVVFCVADRSGTSPTAGTNSTLRVAPGGACSMTFFDSNGPVTPPQAFSMNAGLTIASSGSAIMASFATSAPFYAAIARYYRERWTRQSGGVTIGRSEAGASVSFTPSGAGTAARVTQGTPPGEGETHWEVEVSIDNVTFYRLATVAIGTTTYDDTAATTSYSGNPLSAATGFYTLQKSYKFIAADQARLIGFGSWTSTDRQNDIEVSAVIGSSDVGDEERVDTTTNYRFSLDEKDSGVPTGLCGPVLGSYFAFKDFQTWRLSPTGTPDQPYKTDAVSKTIGAVGHAAIVLGDDATGNPAVYWMSHRGPYRWSVSGLEYIGRNIEDYIQGAVATINLAATKRVAVTVYYPAKRQVWFYVAVGSSNDPSIGFIYDVTTGGWSRIPSGDLWANVRCATLFANTLGASMSRDLKPYVGQAGGNNRLWKADTGTDDNGTTFQAYVLTKAIEPGGPGFFGEVGDSVLLAKASSGVTITDTVTADFGLQTQTGTALLTATGSETRVSVTLEGSALSGVQFVQHQLGDAAAVANAWTLDRLVTAVDKHDAVTR